MGKLSDRIMLKDYVQSKDRLNPPRIDDKHWLVDLCKGGICAILSLIAFWLIWQLTTPNGMAVIYSLAGG